MAGKIWLVGAGPGDPDLITIKGLRLIKAADVILYDRLVNPELLQHARTDAELIFGGKSPKHHYLTQDTINQLLVKRAKKGKVVVRLKGGDPFIFGRGGEEAVFAAKHRIDFAVVPGITAGIAAAAYAGIPVTHRNYSGSYAMVTGHRKKPEDVPTNWEAFAKGVDTIAIYMGIKNIQHIKKQLIHFGKDPSTPTAVIHWGTTNEQHTIVGTLESIDNLIMQHAISNPSMIIIGKVVQLRHELQWFVEQTNEIGLTKDVVQ